MDQTLLSLLIIGGFIVIFPLFFMGIVYMISLFGWQKLAQYHGVDGYFPPTAVTAGGMINLANYRRVLLIKEESGGLWMRTSVFFRVGHKPLFIPFGEIENYRELSGWPLYACYFEVKGVHIRLTKKLEYFTTHL